MPRRPNHSTIGRKPIPVLAVFVLRSGGSGWEYVSRATNCVAALNAVIEAGFRPVKAGGAARRGRYSSDYPEAWLIAVAPKAKHPYVQNPPRKPSPGLPDATVRTFLLVLQSKLIQYDKRLSSRDPNIYRLGHFFDALERVKARVQKILDRDDAEALRGLASVIGDAFFPDFPPARNVLRQIETRLATGATPSLVRNNPSRRGARRSRER